MKCPHCGHPDHMHAGPNARAMKPGTCSCAPPDRPCSCPGWQWWIKAHEWQEEMEFEQERVDRAFGRSMHTLYEGDD